MSGLSNTFQPLLNELIELEASIQTEVTNMDPIKQLLMYRLLKREIAPTRSIIRALKNYYDPLDSPETVQHVCDDLDCDC